LEARRVQRDYADGVVVVGLEVLDSDRGFLGRDVANCGLSDVIACLTESRTVYAVDSDNVFQDRGALVRRFPVQQNPICLYSSERNEGRDGDFEAEHLHQLLDRLREDLVGAEGDPAWDISTCASISSGL
jgi:hypothetical protein